MPSGINQGESYERPPDAGVTFVFLPQAGGPGRIVPAGWMQHHYKVRAGELRSDGKDTSAGGVQLQLIRTGRLLMSNGQLLEGAIVAMWRNE
jgi:hypothetical protein